MKIIGNLYNTNIYGIHRDENNDRFDECITITSTEHSHRWLTVTDNNTHCDRHDTSAGGST